MVRFVEQARKEGKSEEAIRHALLDAGWQMDIILSAMQTNMHTTKDNQVKPMTKSMLQKSKDQVKKQVKRASKTISKRRGNKSAAKAS
jgi:hypothetical protein